MLHHQLMCPPDEVAEVRHTESALLAVISDQRGEHLDPLWPRAVGIRLPADRWLDLVGANEIVRQLGGESPQLLDRAADGRVEVSVRHLVGDLDQQLTRERRSDEVRVAFDVHNRSELPEDRRSEPVIGVDRDLAVDFDHPLECGADTVGQFLGRLVGEGDAENALRFDAPAFHQLSDSLRDRGGLSGAGAGGDPGRDQWSVDDRFLLGGGNERRHDENASRPSGWTGHTIRTAHVRHASPGVAGQDSSLIATPTACIRSRSSSSDEGSNARVHPF